MRPGFWGIIVFMLTVVVAATPASGGEPYVAIASEIGDAAYMVPGPKGVFSEPKVLQRMSDNGINGLGASRANGIGDFDGDGGLDYILAVGSFFNHHVYVFPGKIDPETNLGAFGSPLKVGSFTEGWTPSGMTVADFNGDKRLDFVVTSGFSSNCVLFLNEGGGEEDVFLFRSILLRGTGAPLSYGIDAADFTNDGLVDFIVASTSAMDPFKVNINLGNDENGDPQFDSRRFDLPAGRNIGGYGVAAANFIEDVDGNADLAISTMRALDIYRGDGSGSFIFVDSYSLPLLNSPLDNGDFDRDGHQDLIAGNFDDNHRQLIVLFGQGDGDFRFYPADDIYTLTEDVLAFQGSNPPPPAVTGLPFVFNKAPVAQLTPLTITATVGETIELDASASYDDDGVIVDYQWDYGEGVAPDVAINTTADTGSGSSSGEAQSSYVYFDSGTYHITLTVIDDQGASSTVQAEVIVEALAVSVYISPRKLNLESKGKWITATIRVPAGYDARGINADNLFLVVSDDAEPIPAQKVYPNRGYRKHHKKKYRRIRTLKAKFDRQALISALSTGNNALTVSGEIATSKASLEFKGACSVEAYEKQNKKSYRTYLWKRILYFFSKMKNR